MDITDALLAAFVVVVVVAIFKMGLVEKVIAKVGRDGVDVTVHGQKTPDLRAAFTVMAVQFGEVAERVGTLEKSDAAKTYRIGHLESLDAAKAARIDALEESDSAKTHRIAELETALATALLQLSVERSRADAGDGRIRELEIQVANLSVELAAAKAS